MESITPWIPAIVPAVITLVSAGMWLSTIRGHSKTLDEHGARLSGHDEDLRDHAVQIAAAKAWQDGYNARAAKHG